jgi:8-oxo-dGTP pyrophosphatase MutT (NUDIX family)
MSEKGRTGYTSLTGLDPFLNRLAGLHKPVDGWGSFRRGARPAAVVLILFRRDRAWRVPFVARRADLSSHPGQIGLPGGGVHPGEDAWAAAAREAHEEIGVDRAALVPLGAGTPFYSAVSNNSVVPFVAWLPHEDPAFRRDPGEVDAVLEVPLARLVDDAAWVRGPQPWPGRNLPVGDAMIWGLTARILDELVPHMRSALERL